MLLKARGTGIYEILRVHVLYINFFAVEIIDTDNILMTMMTWWPNASQISMLTTNKLTAPLKQLSLM